MVNEALYRTAIPLHSIAADELGGYHNNNKTVNTQKSYNILFPKGIILRKTRGNARIPLAPMRRYESD